MKKLIKYSTLITLVGLTSSCDLVDRVEQKAAVMSNYRNSALGLAKQNRELQAEIVRLKFEIQTMKSQNNYLKIQLEKLKTPVTAKSEAAGKELAREIASISPVPEKEDLVKFDVYKWTPSQVLAMAEKEFDNKNFEKSAQFFHAFSKNFPGHKKINDSFLFQAGVASFESGKHHDWTLHNLGVLVKEYPTSKFYRGAKLWMALTHLQMGDKDKFFGTVEEFRKKYRNTPEWKILSQHYESIVQKYKKN